MRPILLFVGVAVLSLAACGDDDPTGPAIPNLVGTYDGTWTQTVEGEGLETTTEVCPGTVTVTEQEGQVFEGTFSQAATEDCDAGNGFVTGTITADGSLTLLLGASGGGGPGFEESTGCTILSADDFYTGTWTDGLMEFETSLTALCPQSGDTETLWTFAFAGS